MGWGVRLPAYFSYGVECPKSCLDVPVVTMPRRNPYSHSPKDPRLARRNFRELKSFKFREEVELQRFLHGDGVLASRNPRLIYPRAFGTTERLPASDPRSANFIGVIILPNGEHWWWYREGKEKGGLDVKGDK